MRVPESHPRHESLMIRERLVKGVEEGITALEGLMAHGRGEAFDYILGETTRPFAERAMRAAVARTLLAERPVVSVNGNLVALCPKNTVDFARITSSLLEANIFYRTEERIRKIVNALEVEGASQVLGLEPDARIEGLDGPRGLCARDGIDRADVVHVPLEDGDRTEALVRSGKLVITVDLNPMSRTAMMAGITIVDNVVRAMPMMVELAGEMTGLERKELEEIVGSYDNKAVLSEAMGFMASRLEGLASETTKK